MSGVSDSFGRRILSSPDGKEIWSHLLATAMTAAELCRVAQMRAADEAFSCGLLHDIGKLILLRADAPCYSEILAKGERVGNLLEVEQRAFGFDHAELGAAAAVSWELPGAVSHMIRFHHEPKQATAGLALAHTLHTADTLVHLKEKDLPMSGFLNSGSVETFGLTAIQFDTIWDTVSAKLNEVTTAFV